MPNKASNPNPVYSYEAQSMNSRSDTSAPRTERWLGLNTHQAIEAMQTNMTTRRR